MHSVAVPVLGIIINILLQCAEANLTLDFKVTKISANHKSANCNVANTTYAHGETFKLDCKTQCVCENGRHACSSLCPKEQLPAPEDTISCRSPRLVEVPGHCCKMWLCENPTADVYATCHNTSTSPWTPCSHRCGLGISTRFTTTTAGCNQLSNLRLCENRKCETQQHDNSSTQTDVLLRPVDRETKQKQKYLMKTKQLKPNKLKRSSHQHQKHYLNNNNKQQQPVIQEHLEYEHRIRKGHECRSLQRLGPARVRLGECVSKKLYRPKICGHCHQNTKCCVPSVSTTIQVELLCPLNAVDPISFVQQQLNAEQQQQQGQDFYTKKTTTTTASSSTSSPSLTSLWDTHSLDAIDQEYLQSHQIQIANKFIAVEWILKCECTKTDNCQRIDNTTAATRADSSSSSRDGVGNSNNINNHKHHDYDDNENIDIGNSGHINNNNNRNIKNFNYFKLNHKNSNSNKNSYSTSKWKNSMLFEDYKQAAAAAAAIQIDKIPDDTKNVDKHVGKNVVNEYENGMDNENENGNDGDNDSEININKNYNNGKRNTNIHNRSHSHSHSHSNSHSHRFNHKKQIKDYDDEINNNNNDNSNGNDKYKNSIKMINSQDYVGEEQYDEEQQMYNEEVEQKKWPAFASASAASSSSDEIQPDIIPYPPPPFSANKHTSNNNNNNNNYYYNNNYNNNNKNTQANWIKEKLKLEHNKQIKQLQQQQQQQQEFNEHWLLQQYSNNKPYHKVNLAT